LGPLKQFHILTNPDNLRKYKLSISDIEEAVSKNNQNSGGNILERGGQGFAVRGLGTIKTEKDIENIVLKSENGVPIYVRDVASVEIAPPPPSGILGYNIPSEKVAVNSGVEGIVLLRRYENPSESLKDLREKLSELQEKNYPQGSKFVLCMIVVF
jgi:cobalt-zinc-cadmium resistance protein CzcA